MVTVLHHLTRICCLSYIQTEVGNQTDKLVVTLLNEQQHELCKNDSFSVTSSHLYTLSRAALL